MGASQKSGMDRSAVIRTMDRECLRKVPDPYPFVRAHHSIQTVLILPDLLLLLLLLLLLKLLPLLVEGAEKKTAPAAVVAIEGEDAAAVEIAVAVTVVLVKIIIIKIIVI